MANLDANLKVLNQLKTNGLSELKASNIEDD